MDREPVMQAHHERQVDVAGRAAVAARVALPSQPQRVRLLETCQHVRIVVTAANHRSAWSLPNYCPTTKTQEAAKEHSISGGLSNTAA